MDSRGRGQYQGDFPGERFEMAKPDHAAFMREALSLAEQAAQRGEVPVGALIVDPSGEVLARAHNSPITLKDPTAHAELLAMRRAAEKLGNYRLVGATLYVTLEPCAMCMGAAVHARIERVVFGAPDPKSGACGSVYSIGIDGLLNHRLRVTAGVLGEDAQRLLKEFFRSRR